MSPILAKADVSEVNSAVVLDCLTIGLKMLEIVIKLKQNNIPWISRKSIYKMPPSDMFNAMQNMFRYSGGETEKIK